ncbi:hypothetical protein ELUCI_v1c05060 [Williamsoniiplasma lucivorax]|uniref:Uncharacterized protein n=2 Tax=Williamsoniiplasma lucivorax TaxID=209274 RepID=A0A2S5RDN6_9MOLU|nr:hypothetical protein ELUCI_v1c05060 [Williamsoniiplasma lucivorax]
MQQNQETPVLLDIRSVSNLIPKPSTKARWYQSGKYLKYIAREEATQGISFTNEEIILLGKAKKEANKKYQELFLHHELLEQSNSISKEQCETLKATAYKDYYSTLNQITSTKEFHTGVFDLNGELTKKQLYAKEKSFNKIKDEQLVWSGVLSFSKEFMDEHQIHSGEDFQKIISKNLKEFMALNGFNHKNLETVFSFHKNTDNTHFHFAFFEKYPTKYNKQTQQAEYRKEYMLNKDSLRNFENSIAFDIQNQHVNYDDIFQSRDDLRNSFKTTHHNNKEILQDLIHSLPAIDKKLFKRLKILKQVKLNNPEVSFGNKKISSKLRTDLYNISDFYLKNNPETQEKYAMFLRACEKNSELELELFWNGYSKSSNVIDELKGLTFEEIKKRTKLSNDELIWDAKFDLSNPIEYLKFKRHDFYFRNILSKNEDNEFEGVIPSIANALLEDIDEISIPKENNSSSKLNRFISNNYNNSFDYEKWKQNQLNYVVNKALDKAKADAQYTANRLQMLIDQNKQKQLTHFK